LEKKININETNELLGFAGTKKLIRQYENEEGGLIFDDTIMAVIWSTATACTL
jgi:hypothetical protein